MGLPECEYRADLGDAREFFCRHTRVHVRDHLVHAGICRICKMRHRPCEEPRPVPESLEKAKSAPPLMRRAWNLVASLAAFTADGFRTVTREEYETRLAICDGCGERRNNRCLACGCNLSLKARGRAFRCPLKKWPDST